MTSEAFIESGMKFGPYAPGGCCFRIERSATYTALKDEVKIAEFLLLQDSSGERPCLWIVEAKESSPNVREHPDSEDSNTYVDSIREKLVNSLSLGLALGLGRHPKTEHELPGPFKEVDLSKTRVRFGLIIKNSKKDWLPPIQEKMNKVMRPTIKTWALGPNSLVVMNEAMAKKHGLILT